MDQGNPQNILPSDSILQVSSKGLLEHIENNNQTASFLHQNSFKKKLSNDPSQQFHAKGKGLGPKKKKSLVPVQRQRMIGRLFSFYLFFILKLIK